VKESKDVCWEVFPRPTTEQKNAAKIKGGPKVHLHCRLCRTGMTLNPTTFANLTKHFKDQHKHLYDVAMKKRKSEEVESLKSSLKGGKNFVQKELAFKESPYSQTSAESALGDWIIVIIKLTSLMISHF
jgi:hypothetical protein